MFKKDGIYIKEGNKKIFIPSTDSKFDIIKQNILLQDKQEYIKQLIKQLLIVNRWEKYKNLDKIVDEIYNIIVLYIKNDKELNKCIKTLNQLVNKENIINFNEILKLETVNIYQKLDKTNFFKNKELLKKLFKIKETMIGEGELLLTLISNCRKGKIVDLFLNDLNNKIYKQIEIKSKDGRIGNEHNVRKFLDKLKKSKNCFDINIEDSDTIIFKKILNKINFLSLDEKIKLLYNIRTEKSSILKDYFIEQIKAILEEFDNIDYSKLMLSIQIYSYCSNMKADYIILLNDLNLLIIKPGCLWGIYEQLLKYKIKIGFNVSDRKGFSVAYIANK